jgi:hypothetical protein
MGGRIVLLRDGDHEEVHALLPWYVNGGLDAAETALVEAHLAGCAECVAGLKFERRLSAEVEALPFDIEQGWIRLRDRLELSASKASIRGRLEKALRGSAARWRGRGPLLAWAVAAQIGLLAAAAVLAIGDARYHALGAPAEAATGNAVVIFRPDATEAELREALEASHARLVGGPTAAGAYVIRIPTPERAAGLRTLRGRPVTVLAQPIDGGGPP